MPPGQIRLMPFIGVIGIYMGFLEKTQEILGKRVGEQKFREPLTSDHSFETCYQVKDLTINGMATNTPRELPRFVKAMISNILVILFFKKPLNVVISVGNSSKSLTFGLLK
ncbi:hypothetical protein PITCH_A1690006 [uncultured Desulfobacterium sp.]|uniref:Uncharacterized protein n=1 Tax=uncultured Desulfobacterium sp. TaxID=201089 RepID=A0A445MUN6_9BACT|nr:hypothetical protein PITCH_A1690006 [uncultured Desulfobacterium sp.]